MSDTSTIQQVSEAEFKAKSITSDLSALLRSITSEAKKDFDEVKSTIHSWVSSVQHEAGKVDSLIVNDVKAVGSNIITDLEYVIDNIPITISLKHNSDSNSSIVYSSSANGEAMGPTDTDLTNAIKLEDSDLVVTSEASLPKMTVQGGLDIGAVTTEASAKLPTLLDYAKNLSFAIHVSIDGTAWVDDPAVLSISNNHPALTISAVVVDGRTIDWTKVQKVRVIQYSRSAQAVLGIEYVVAMDTSTPVQFDGEFNGLDSKSGGISIKFALTVSASRLLSYDELDNLVLTSK